jgi:hypothetical protein
MRLFDRHCLFENIQITSTLFPLTSSAPKRTTMATICLTSLFAPDSSYPLRLPRTRRAPHEEIETPPSVFGAPDMAAMLLTSSQLLTPSLYARHPTLLPHPPRRGLLERIRSLHCLEERPLISPSVERVRNPRDGRARAVLLMHGP